MTATATAGKKELAYEIIKNKIIVGHLPPLMDISEEALQSELEISRTPIREALQQLQKEGFVYIYPRKGTIVSEVTQDLIREVYQLRLLNEAFIAKQACHTIPEEWLVEMKRRFAEPPPMEQHELRLFHIAMDRDLHVQFLHYCDNRFLQNIMAIVYDHNHRIRLKVSAPGEVSHDNSIAEHIEIIDAMLSQNAERIEQKVMEHITNSRSISVRHFRR